MAIVGVLPEAEQELEALPMAEEVALRTVMGSWRHLEAGCPFLTRAPSGVPRSGSSGHARDAVPGARSTGARERSTSSSVRSGRRRR
jgi:hypothetical protein